jgi:2-keto-4-pentenoate hydratase/2-oxohepta-3-ene-1,7-dioic acid hydratase in catechol pathway
MNSVQFNSNTIYPSKILCVGRNFVAHIEELGNETPDEMVVFIKPNSAIGSVLYSKLGGEPLHYEAELCFLVRGNALAGVGIGLDLTKRELQSRLKEKSLPWERAKAFDGAVLFSEFVNLNDKLESLSIRLDVDGKLRQSGGTELMTYKPTEILQELWSFSSLEDGDIIMTGTPAGVGAVKAGEQFEGTVLSRSNTLVKVRWIAQ